MIKRRNFLKLFLYGSVYTALHGVLPVMAQSKYLCKSFPAALRLLAVLLCTVCVGAPCSKIFAQVLPDSKIESLGQIPGNKVALVIGNADYPVHRLKNPINDARSMADALRELGFNVDQRENIDQNEMIEAMKDFWLKGRTANARVFYFAGHGLQYQGENHLLPIDAVLKAEEDIPLKAPSVKYMMDKLKTISTGVNIIILDACRSTPFLKTRSINSPNRSSDNGLAHVVAPKGTLIAFSTAPGAVAYDGTEENSIYTRRLVAHLKVPGLPIEQLFKRVRIDVVQSTKEKQIPWESSSLLGDFCFRIGRAGQCPSTEFSAR